MQNEERIFKGMKLNGFLGIFMLIVVLAATIYAFTLDSPLMIAAGSIGSVLFFMLCPGFLTIEPNNGCVMVFFGKYKGTITDNGFFWVNPFYTKKRVTLRARNLDISPIKVNDKRGNPVMIGTILVWKIKDTYKALFDIDAASLDPTGKNLMGALENFVKVQSDAAQRKIAGMYPYDSLENDEDEITLRSDSNEISQKLEEELNSRLSIAGIEVVEARINYLAYAAEIAGVMLRRQQADAIISAREKIVEGAVSMVQLALNRLANENVVELDEERKAAMISNLLVVLCADEPAQPIVNTGTLHH